MQEDFHYYATYCAAFLAGFSPDESKEICYCAQLVDLCSKSFLARIKGPRSAATTQLSLEMMDAHTDPISLQNITRIWSSFHFLPANLNAEIKATKIYKNKFRLICGPNGELAADTVELAKGRGTQAAGIAMHIIADTWAHRCFAGTPSLVINNTIYDFKEYIPNGDDLTERLIKFRHNPKAADDLENGIFVNSVYTMKENSIMNLGHGRAGHLPDYSFMRYKYMPAWGGYSEIYKDNPNEYLKAFCQMIYAMQYLRGEHERFELNRYAEETAAPYRDEIWEILCRRQLSASEDWKAFGVKLSGTCPDDFDLDRYIDEYTAAGSADKDGTFLGRFILAAMAQKSMVTNKIFSSGNLLAGFSVDYSEKGARGIKDFLRLAEYLKGGDEHD